MSNNEWFVVLSLIIIILLLFYMVRVKLKNDRLEERLTNLKFVIDDYRKREDILKSYIDDKHIVYNDQMNLDSNVKIDDDWLVLIKYSDLIKINCSLPDEVIRLYARDYKQIT